MMPLSFQLKGQLDVFHGSRTLAFYRRSRVRDEPRGGALSPRPSALRAEHLGTLET